MFSGIGNSYVPVFVGVGIEDYLPRERRSIYYFGDNFNGLVKSLINICKESRQRKSNKHNKPRKPPKGGGQKAKRKTQSIDGNLCVRRKERKIK